MKLKITKDKIVLKEYKDDEDMGNLFKMTGIESTFKAGKDIASFVKASVTLIYKSFGSFLYNILHEDGDMTKFAKRMQDLDKEYITDTNTAIQSLDNTTRNMILSAGLKESEIDMIFAAGIPAGAIAERLQNKSYSPPKDKPKDYKAGSDPYAVIIENLYARYLGESGGDAISYSSDITNTIKNVIRQRMSPQVVEWINGLTDFSEKDKKISARILKLSFLKNMDVNIDKKLSDKLSADIRSIIDSLIESFHILKITKNNTNLGLLREFSDQELATIARDVGQILKAIAVCIIFEKEIIEAFFSNLNTIAAKENDKIKKDFSTICLLIIAYKSYLNLIENNKNNPENFNIKSYADSLKSSIPPGFENHADKSVLERLKGLKIDPVEIKDDNSNKALFIGTCKSIIKLLSEDFKVYPSLLNNYYEKIQKYVVKDAKSIGEDKNTQVSESKSDLVYLFDFLKKEVKNVNVLDNIATIENLIEELTSKDEEGEGEPEEATAEAGEESEDDQSQSQ